MLPTKSRSSNLLSANIKSLRLFRHICRLMPFILRIHELYLFPYIVIIELLQSNRNNMLQIGSEKMLMKETSPKLITWFNMVTKPFTRLRWIIAIRDICIDSFCPELTNIKILEWTDFMIRRLIESICNLIVDFWRVSTEDRNLMLNDL